MQAPATNLDRKPIKALSMPAYVPSTGPANIAESGRRLVSVSNRSRAGSGKSRRGRPRPRRRLGRKPRAGRAPPTVGAKRTAAATSAAIKVPPSTPPTSPAHRLLQLPHLPKCPEYILTAVFWVCAMHRCIQITLSGRKHSAEFTGVHLYDIVHLYVFFPNRR